MLQSWTVTAAFMTYRSHLHCSLENPHSKTTTLGTAQCQRDASHYLDHETSIEVCSAAATLVMLSSYLTWSWLLGIQIYLQTQKHHLNEQESMKALNYSKESHGITCILADIPKLNNMKYQPRWPTVIDTCCMQHTSNSILDLVFFLPAASFKMVIY